MTGVVVAGYDSFEILLFALLAVFVAVVVWGLSFLLEFLIVRFERSCGAEHYDKYRK
jgi:ABC-type polysaccharide/polyol phosphate export permease